MKVSGPSIDIVRMAKENKESIITASLLLYVGAYLLIGVGGITFQAQPAGAYAEGYCVNDGACWTCLNAPCACGSNTCSNENWCSGNDVMWYEESLCGGDGCALGTDCFCEAQVMKSCVDHCNSDYSWKCEDADGDGHPDDYVKASDYVQEGCTETSSTTAECTVDSTTSHSDQCVDQVEYDAPECNACQYDSDCTGADFCSNTYSDYCSGYTLVEYDSDKTKDSTTVSDSCSNTCDTSADPNECVSCSVTCSAPSTSSYKVAGVCGCSSNYGDTCGESTGACQTGTVSCSGTCTGDVGPSSETCNDVDDDCDGSVDEGGVCCTDSDGDGVCDSNEQCDWTAARTSPVTWYSDDDGDGYYDETTQSCSDPGTGWVR